MHLSRAMTPSEDPGPKTWHWRPSVFTRICSQAAGAGASAGAAGSVSSQRVGGRPSQAGNASGGHCATPGLQGNVEREDSAWRWLGTGEGRGLRWCGAGVGRGRGRRWSRAMEVGRLEGASLASAPTCRRGSVWTRPAPSRRLHPASVDAVHLAAARSPGVPSGHWESSRPAGWSAGERTLEGAPGSRSARQTALRGPSRLRSSRGSLATPGTVATCPQRSGHKHGGL